MPYPFPYGETVVQHSLVKSGTDSLGADVFASTDTIWPNAAVWQPSAAESLSESSTGTVDLRDLVTTDLNVVIAAGAAVSPQDRFTVRGELYDVNAPAANWVSPLTGWAPGTVVPLKRVTG